MVWRDFVARVCKEKVMHALKQRIQGRPRKAISIREKYEQFDDCERKSKRRETEVLRG